MPALDALTAKAHTYDDLFTDDWRRFAEGFTASLRGERPGTVAHLGYTQSAEEFTRHAARMLTLAHVYYVSPNMNALVTAAAESWPEDEPITIEDFPTQQGWLYIPGGVTTIDIRGRAIRTSVMSWSVVGGGVDIIMWCDKEHDPMAARQLPAFRTLPKWTPWHLGTIALNQPLPQTMRMGRVLPPEVSDQVHIEMFDDGGGTMTFPQGWSPAEMTPRVGPNVELAWLVSALRIMAQPIATHERVGIPAGVRKSLARYKRRIKQTAVTVVDFRRREGAEGSSGTREYSHQWLRRGHWRRQWIGSEKYGTRRQVRIWIHPSICGPSDKPLLIRDHVNALVR